MFDNTLTAIYIALLISPYISLVAIVPFLIRDYREHKVILVDRSIHFYLLVIFWLSAFFMTMLPFPTFAAAANMNIEKIQLIPFKQITDGIKSGSFSFGVVGFWNLMSLLFNVLLLAPVGYLLRYIFKNRFKTVLIISFCTSLFFELTQLSRLFFIYPVQYRTFDVDDIISNVLGALLGWLFAPVLMKFSPLSRISSGIKIRQGGDVSLRRRIPAIFIDQLIAFILLSFIGIFIKAEMKIKFPLMFILFLFINAFIGLVMYLKSGSSIGYVCTGLKLRSMISEKVTLIQCVVRMIILGITSFIPLWMGYLLYLCTIANRFLRIVFVSINVLIIIIYVFMVFSFLLNGLTHGTTLYHDRICRTYLSLSDTSKKLDGLNLIMSDELSSDTVSLFSDNILHFLEESGIDHKAALRVQLLADGCMNDWLDEKLAGNMCELRFAHRLWSKTLFLSVFAPEKNETPSASSLDTSDVSESYIEMLSGVRLSYEEYFSGMSNVIAIDIP